MGALDLGLEGWMNSRSITAECHSEPCQWHEEDMEVDKSKLGEEAVGHWFDWSTEVVQVREREEAGRAWKANMCRINRQGSVEAEAEAHAGGHSLLRGPLSVFQPGTLSLNLHGE